MGIAELFGIPPIEEAIVSALRRTPPGYVQRIDGLMCERELIHRTEPRWRINWALWRLIKRGVVVGGDDGHWRRRLPTFRLARHEKGRGS